MTPSKTYLLGLLSPLFALASTNANAAEVRLIRTDAASEGVPFNETGDFCVGAGRANEGLRADWQAQLRDAHEQCGFRYIRFHGLLCDDMGVYFVDRDGKEVYNWQYIDALFDNILETGMRPFVEIGFMPGAMASGPETIFWWRGNVTPPCDYARWERLIAAMLQHWTERYGEEEVTKWYFEVWNEPNLQGFWLGKDYGLKGDEWQAFAREKYFELYTSTAHAVKSVNKNYRVGGPATAGNAWVPETIDFCEKNDVPLDFITTHNYAVMSGYLDEYGNAGTVFAPNRDAMTSDVKRVRSQIEASAKPGLELHYTEWSSSYTPADPLHDSYHSAAFILNKLKGIGPAAQSMSYWTFTDIFEEAGPRTSPFHGGFGLINYQGIRKPSFYAYQFLNQLGSTELPNEDSDSFVCKDEKGNIQALFWDFTITHPGPDVNNQDYYNKIQPAKDAQPVELQIKDLAPGEYRLVARKVGFKSNDAYTAYLEMGAPQQLTRPQVAELKAVSDGASFLEALVTVGEDGTFEQAFPMLENDVILVTLEKK